MWPAPVINAVSNFFYFMTSFSKKHSSTSEVSDFLLYVLILRKKHSSTSEVSDSKIFFRSASLKAVIWKCKDNDKDEDYGKDKDNDEDEDYDKNEDIDKDKDRDKNLPHWSLRASNFTKFKYHISCNIGFFAEVTLRKLGRKMETQQPPRVPSHPIYLLQIRKTKIYLLQTKN